MPGGSFFLYLKFANGVNGFFKTAVTDSDEVLSINNCVFEIRPLSTFTEAMFTGVESAITWALQNAAARKNTNRVTNRFNRQKFYQTYIISFISHISKPFFYPVFEAGDFYIFVGNG